jgi:hypothetical protein
MKTITLSEKDADQVKAILLTHAEMQDGHAIQSMELHARLKKDYQGTAPEDGVINDLETQVEDMEVDSENLKRIAAIFE